MIRRPPRSTPLYSSAASDVYKRQVYMLAADAAVAAAVFGLEHLISYCNHTKWCFGPTSRRRHSHGERESLHSPQLDRERDGARQRAAATRRRETD